jgi:hypothetical protein
MARIKWNHLFHSNPPFSFHFYFFLIPMIFCCSVGHGFKSDRKSPMYVLEPIAGTSTTQAHFIQKLKK